MITKHSIFMQEALPEFEQEKASSKLQLHTAFSNIFSDHVAVFADLAFVADAKPTAAPDDALLPEPEVPAEHKPEPAVSPAAPGEYRCMNCTRGKGCRYRGLDGHRPRAPE